MGIDMASYTMTNQLPFKPSEYYSNTHTNIRISILVFVAILSYKYNKPIRHMMFNFNKLVSDLDIHANTPSS